MDIIQIQKIVSIASLFYLFMGAVVMIWSLKLQRKEIGKQNKRIIELLELILQSINNDADI